MNDFTTPRGLKIRLRPAYFYAKIFKPGEKFFLISKEEMTSNIPFSNIIDMIEPRYLLPAALTFLFTIIAIFSSLTIPSIFICGIAVILLSVIWRNYFPPTLLDGVLHIISTIYSSYISKIFFVPFIIVCAVSFAIEMPVYIFCYLGLIVIKAIIEFIANAVLANSTKNRYGMTFNDTEICAFYIFNMALLNQTNINTSTNELIKDYVATMKNAELDMLNEISARISKLTDGNVTLDL